MYSCLKKGWRRRAAVAFLVAAATCVLHPVAGMRKVGLAIGTLLRIGGNSERVSEERLRARIEVCRRCPIFYTRLQTCGSPLSKEMRGMGCYCNMELKAQFSESDCWLDGEIEDYEAGWRAAGC